MEGFTNGTARSVPQVGLSYMLAGGSDESNTDPMATEPPPGEDWVTTPQHVMMMAPGGFDVANFKVDHTSGYPYIMYDDTDYEHLMIPVKDMPSDRQTDRPVRGLPAPGADPAASGGGALH